LNASTMIAGVSGDWLSPSQWRWISSHVQGI
jgi:hypothetical protein